MTKTIDQAQKASKSLLKHTGIMFVSCVVLQIAITLRDNKIDLISQLLLVGIAIYYVWYNITSKDQLSKLRFGRLVAHLVGFLVVNLSYHTHAFVLFVTNNPAIKGTDSFPINSGWFGVLFGMMTFWGLGLLIHTVALITNRGFEELSR